MPQKLERVLKHLEIRVICSSSHMKTVKLIAQTKIMSVNCKQNITIFSTLSQLIRRLII